MVLRPFQIKSIHNKFCALLSTLPEKKYDVGIVGGGIVGTATARQLLLRYPSMSVAIFEKEPKLGIFNSHHSLLGMHQSSHNSGVIHSGLYYMPGSKRAKLCVAGSALMYDYCASHNIPFERCGKVIVAVRPEELPRLEGLYKRGVENGVPDIKMIGKEELAKLEPFCTGLQAIHVPGTGITDFGKVVESLGEDAKAAGCEMLFNFEASSFESTKLGKSYGTLVKSKSGQSVSVRHLITCPGLYADRVAQAAGGGQPNPVIIPFRGDFLKLKPEYSNLVRGMIYPVPNPAFPFLGVHFTRRTNGEVWLGPNAVLAFAREGYRWRDVNLGDIWEVVRHPGLRALVQKHFMYGVGELYRDLVPSAYLEHLTPYMPQLTMAHIAQGPGPSGVRAQALGQGGNIVDDFVFEIPKDLSILHVRNAPSPAATSSLSIANEIVDMAATTFQFS